MTVPVDLGKLIAIVKNDFVKKTVYDQLVAKVNNIYTSDFVLKTNYQTDKTELEKKTPDVSNLVKKANLTELENKIPDVSSLARKTALISVENKISDVSTLVKKRDYNAKVTEFNKLAADVFNPRLAQTNLITKTDFDVKLSRINRKITGNK